MRVLKVLMILLFVQTAAFGQSDFQEGKHYRVVAEEKTETLQVTEFFSLFCSHCFQFEPFMDTLKNSLKPGAVFAKSHVNYLPRNNEKVQFGIVKAFLTMKELGMEDQLTKQFFAAIHVKQLKIDTEEDIKAIFLANGVSETVFNNIYNSSQLKAKAEAMAKHWTEKSVESVPTIVVNGKYLINMGSLKTIDQLVTLTNELLEKD